MVENDIRYLKCLAKQYPTIAETATEIINLQSILSLPKGTEHFISDIHGEHEAFLHILNSCSGEVRDKLEALFGENLSYQELDDLATLIYYPAAKLALAADMIRRLHELGDLFCSRNVSGNFRGDKYAAAVGGSVPVRIGKAYPQ